jgi:hypothetical protein
LTFSSKEEQRKKLEISHQYRFGIVKDLWISQEKGRYHHHLLAPESTVTLIQSEKGIDAVEDLEEIQCWIQQQTPPFNEKERIQYIKAENGTYFYLQQEFLAKQMKFACYDQPPGPFSSDIPLSQLLFKGKADAAYFQFCHHHPEFNADHFEVELEK